MRPKLPSRRQVTVIARSSNSSSFSDIARDVSAVLRPALRVRPSFAQRFSHPHSCTNASFCRSDCPSFTHGGSCIVASIPGTFGLPGRILRRLAGPGFGAGAPQRVAGEQQGSGRGETYKLKKCQPDLLSNVCILSMKLAVALCPRQNFLLQIPGKPKNPAGWDQQTRR